MVKIKGGQFWKLLKIDENNPEYELYDSLVTEFTEISGWPIYYYIKLGSKNLDYLYGEDPSAQYTKAYETKLIYEPTEEENLLDSFGITSDETIQYMQIPKTVFKETVEYEYKNNYEIDFWVKPKPGDCIRTLWNNKLYEVVEVGSEQKIFQGRKLVWEMITKPYRHSEDSVSADEMLYETPDENDFPNINTTTTTEVLSAYGENKEIAEEAEENYDYEGKPTNTLYGYDTLD